MSPELAYEYGYFDARHLMGYHAPNGYGQEYAKGYAEGRFVPREPDTTNSYAHTENWGQ